MSQRIGSILLAFFLVVSSQFLRAATEHAGRVTLGGMPVPGVRVTAAQGDQRVAASTNHEGVYRFPALAEGVWTMRVEMLGFAPLTQDVTVGAGASPAIWELTVLPFSEITRGIPPPPPTPPAQPAQPARRSAASSPPQTRTNQPARGAAPSPAPSVGGGLVRGDAAAATPAGSPAAAAARAAAAGADRSAFADEPGSSPGASADSFVVSGSVNNGTLDQQRALADARRAAGIRLYNGSLSVNGGSSAFDARPYSATGVRASKPDSSNLSVSANFGGPIRIPGLMRNTRNLSLSYQRTSNNEGSTLFQPMPSLLQRSGDFSQTLDGFGRALQIVDPLTGLPFPGNAIPADRISPQAAALLRYYPQPNPLATGAYNYQIATLSTRRSDGINGGMPNLVSTTTNQFGFNGGYNRSTNESTSLFGFDNSSRGSGFNSSINWSHRFLPSNQQIRVRHSYNRQTNTAEPFFANRTNVSGEAGITGNNQDPVNWGPPNLSFASGIAGLSDGQYSFNRNQSHTLNGETFKSRGRHSMTLGGNVRYQRLDIVSQQNARGSFTFNGTQTGYDFADFLLGLPNTSAIAFGNADKHYRAWTYDAYITDDFRVNPNFTIQLGVRWEYEAPVTESLGRLVNLDVADDFSAAAPVIANDGIGPITGRHYPKSLIEPDPFGIQPRIGIAWRPIVTSTVIIRGGYGMYRNTSVYQSMASLLAQQPPLSLAFNAVNTPDTPLTLANGFIAPFSTTLNTVAIDPEFRVGLVHRWQASIQRDLPASLTLTATFLGGKGLNLPQSFLPNTYAPGAVNPCPGCPSGFAYTTSHGSSTQNSGQLQLRRRLRSGLTWTASYTLSKATDNASSFSGAIVSGQGIAQNWLDLEAERGPSTFDQRHQFTVQTSYTTGQGVSGGSLLTGLKGALVKGWTITTNLTAGSGTPRTPTYPVTSVAGLTGTVRANLTGEPIDAAPDGYYVNPAAFAPPVPGAWGNAGRNSIRGPKQFLLNASVTRSFPLRNRMSLNWQLTANNLLNQVTYSSIGTSVGSTQFGLPTTANMMRRVTTNMRLQF